MAKAFGLDPWQTMRGWTERQLLTALAWLAEEMNQPDQHAWYLMQVACEVRRVLADKPGSIQANDFRMDFKPAARPIEGEACQSPTAEQSARAHKQAFAGLLQGAVEYRTKPRSPSSSSSVSGDSSP